MNDPKQRFSNRVEDYVRYRPGYPAGVLATLRQECGLKAGARIADVGSGTCLLSRLFLEAGCAVVGVEPNAEMRQAGEQALAGLAGFESLDGSAEATGLPSHSIDFITAGQAFHWFQFETARAEFARILTPGGWVALVWNERTVATTPFMRGYEEILLRYNTDYQASKHRNIDPAQISAFFHPAPCQLRTFANRQVFDYAGAEGRLRSSSYTPAPGQPGFTEMIAALRELFAAYQTSGQVAFEYITRLYYGQLPPVEGQADLIRQL